MASGGSGGSSGGDGGSGGADLSSLFSALDEMKEDMRKEFIARPEFEEALEGIKSKLTDNEAFKTMEEELENLRNKIRSLEGQLSDLLSGQPDFDEISNALNDLAEKVEE